MNKQQVPLEEKYEIQNPLVKVPNSWHEVVEWLMRERGRGVLGDEFKIGEAVDYLIEKAGDVASLGWLDDRIDVINRFSGGEPYSPYIYYDVVFLSMDGTTVELGHCSHECNGAQITHTSFAMNEAGAGALAEELLEEVLLPALERLTLRGAPLLGTGSARNQDRRVGGMGSGAAPVSATTMTAITSSLGR